MRTLKVLLIVFALAAVVLPADAQTFIGTGRYSYDDSTDGDATDNVFRVGNATTTSPIGAATFVGGNYVLGSTNSVQIGKGTTDPLTMQIIRGWGSLIMLDGKLDLSENGQANSFGNVNGTCYITQTGGTFIVGSAGKNAYFGSPSTSGGFPKVTEGLSESYVRIQGGTMIAKANAWFGGYNCWINPVVSGFPTDPTGMCKGELIITGGTYDNSVAVGGASTLVGYTGGDGRVEVLNNGVAKFGEMYMGNSDTRTYTLTSQGNTVIGTVARDSNAVLKIGKDATVSFDNRFYMFESNKNVELQIEIASLTDFSQFTAGSINIGIRWDTANGARNEPKLTVNLVDGFVPTLGDEWITATTTSGVTLDGGFGTINAPALSDPSWRYEVRVDDGTKLVLAVVPEPATLALLGLGGLALVRRRR